MTAGWKRAPRAPLDAVPKAVMPQNPIPDDLDLEQIFSSVVAGLSSLGPQQLDSQAFWRDILALTGTWRTFHGSESISTTWNELVVRQQLSDFAFIPGSAHAVKFGSAGFIPGRFTFKIGGAWPGDGSGNIAIYHDDNSGWKIWFLATFLEHVDGLGSPDVLEKVSYTNGVTVNGVNGHHELEEVDVAIIGAGQSGLSTLGRLKAMGIKAVALECNSSIGGNWTGRYDTVKLHTARYYSTFPFGHNTFHDDEYPYYLKAADLARGFQKYVSDYGLDVRLSTKVHSAKWNEETQRWTVVADRDGKEVTLRAQHLVFAIGAIGGFASEPDIQNREAYQGTAMHSKDFKNASAWAGKRGIVIGTANTAHDVAENMLDSELASVTMIQRGRTIVVPMQVFKPLHSRFYNANADIAASDRGEWGLPYPIQGAVSTTIFGQWRKREPEMYDGLASRGFKPEVPNLLKIHERAGGQYLDVGASQKIIDGKIKVKNGEIASFTRTGLLFKDGTELEADLIVFATGFQFNIRHQVTKMVGPEIGELLEDNGGLDFDGEPRGAWKAQGHPKIWYTSGEFGMSRFYSRFLAFQIKADLLGKRFEGYKQ